ncbi:MAG: hypothetical protein DLD55_06430 [candidate division SR1 bacterium]|nr:MAG: hypothetical protein DLD55_06430 [candidate division SR1 bacterium]
MKFLRPFEQAKNPVKKSIPFSDKNDLYDNRKLDQQNTHGYSDQDVMSFLRNLDLGSGESVLDIGCGEGKIGLCALSMNSNIKLIAMDFNDRQIQQAKNTLSSNNYDNIELRVGTIIETGLKSDSIDKIIAKMVLHEIQKLDQRKALKEMYRILKKGGKLAIRCIDLNKENQVGFQNIAQEKDRLAGFKSLMKNRYFFTGEELLSYAIGAGFSSIQDKGNIPFIFDPNRFLETDFNGDERKVKKLKEKINEIVNKDNALKEAELEDGKLNIGFRIYLLTK